MNSKPKFLNIEIDESEIKKLCIAKISEMVESTDVDLVFWDTAELKRRTCLSWNTIQDHFFFDPRFPKRKIGTKWMYPARETREFLVLWLSEQPMS